MPRRVAGDHVDVCVVGSGFAGLAAAERLTAEGASVLVLDAGGDVGTSPAPAPSAQVHGDADFDVEDNRVIALGGTSAKWNGVASRLEPAVLAEWPLPAGALDPYLAQAEAWLGVSGAPAATGSEPARRSTLLPATTTLLPHHLPSLEPFAPVVVPFAFVDGGPRRLLVHDLPRVLAAGVDLRTATWVRSVRPAGRRRPAEVHGLDATGQPCVVRARRVILAVGVVEAVRILATSASTGRSRLLGTGINAHPRRRTTVRRAPELMGLRGVLRSYRIGDEFAARGLGRVLLDVNYMEATPMIDVTVEQRVVVGNRLRLGADGGLVAELWLDGRDHATVAAADALITDVAAVLPGAGPTGAIVTRWFHPAGGCPMAATEAAGVVDHDGQVFGAPGVYVAGAATFPTAGAGNPTLTIVAMALRLADHIGTLA